MQSIKCEWNHPECVNAVVKQQFERLYTACTALENCEFPKRKDCPFYKPQKEKKNGQH